MVTGRLSVIFNSKEYPVPYNDSSKIGWLKQYMTVVVFTKNKKLDWISISSQWYVHCHWWKGSQRVENISRSQSGSVFCYWNLQEIEAMLFNCAFSWSNSWVPCLWELSSPAHRYGSSCCFVIHLLMYSRKKDWMISGLVMRWHFADPFYRTTRPFENYTCSVQIFWPWLKVSVLLWLVLQICLILQSQMSIYDLVFVIVSPLMILSVHRLLLIRQ